MSEQAKAKVVVPEDALRAAYGLNGPMSRFVHDLADGKVPVAVDVPKNVAARARKIVDDAKYGLDADAVARFILSLAPQPRVEWREETSPRENTTWALFVDGQPRGLLVQCVASNRHGWEWHDDRWFPFGDLAAAKEHAERVTEVRRPTGDGA